LADNAEFTNTCGVKLLSAMPKLISAPYQDFQTDFTTSRRWQAN